MEYTGYTHCACRDCMEIAIGKPGKAFCHDCEEAGCEHDSECQSPNAYGGSDEEITEEAERTVREMKARGASWEDRVAYWKSVFGPNADLSKYQWDLPIGATEIAWSP